jgi:hypothetical protein
MDQRLTELVRRCISGMTALASTPPSKTLGSGETWSLTIPTERTDGCVRTLAVAGPGVDELELELMDGTNRSHGRDDGHGYFAMVGARGPVCLKAGETYRAITRVQSGRGPVAVRVFQAN